MSAFWACSSDSDRIITDEFYQNNDVAEDPYEPVEIVTLKELSASGVVEKGPFVSGTLLKLFELNGSKLSQSGKSYTGKLNKDDGSFTITASTLKSQYAILEAAGYYKNEISGFNSNGPITLTALVDLKDRRKVNVNLLTHLEYERVMALHEEGFNVLAAKRQATVEILSSFGFEGEFGEPEDLTIFGDQEGDAVLLAISVLLQGNRKEADMSELIADIANEIGENGAWNNMEQKTAIADWAFGTDLAAIRQNVENWKLGPVPNFEKYVEIFWNYVYGLEKCTAQNEGSLLVIKNKYSKNYNEVFVCKDKSWRKATFDDVGSSSDTIVPVVPTASEEDSDFGTIKDTRDGKVYKVVVIGNQIWMAENLNYDTPNEATHCAGENCDAYGRLYPWKATQTDICPEGWHVPTNSEWEKLYAYVDEHNGNEPIEMSLKSKNSWVTPGSNKFGFNALSAGYYWGRFNDIGSDAAWWSSSEDNYDQGYDWRLYNGANYDDLGMPKEVEFAVRCMKSGSELPSNSEVSSSSEQPSSSEQSSSSDVSSSSEQSSSSNVSSSSEQSSSSAKPATNTTKYDCGVYNCFPTDHLNQEKLAAGEYGELLDTRDNQVYRTIQICDQVWMAQNLNYLPTSGTTYCYDDNNSYCKKYGRLYVRAAVSCPAGWHLPDDSEWQKLFTCVGGQSTAAAALRASSGWDKHPELNNADEYGFSSLPAGVYYFGDVDNTGWYLSATGHNDFSVGAGEASVKSTAADYTAISVRCVED